LRLFPLEDVDEQSSDRQGGDGRQHHDDEEERGATVQFQDYLPEYSSGLQEKMNQACGCRIRMAHRVMATRALQSGRLAVNYIAVDRRCDRFVTAAAGIFCDPVIELGDLDGVGISAAGENRKNAKIRCSP